MHKYLRNFLVNLAKFYYGVWRKITKAFGEFSAHNLINETTFILFQYFKDHFGLAERALCVAEPRFMSASGRYLHLWCVVCGKATLVVLCCRPEGGVSQLIVNILIINS